MATAKKSAAKKTVAKKAPKRTITRKVFFFRVNAGANPDTGEPRAVNFSPALNFLNGLAFTTDGRYLNSDDGKQLCCWVDTLRSPYRLRLANIRRGQHPPVESSGSFAPLVLGRGSGLAEITHIVIFPGGICGAEFNFYGPRATQLSYYFALKLPTICPPFRLNSIARPDLEQRLAALNDIKVLDLKVKASFASILTQASEDLGAAMEANIRAVNARPQDEFELKFIRRKNSKLEQRGVPNIFLQAIKGLARRSDLKEQVSVFKLSGADGGGNRFLDVLHEQFTAEKEIEPAANATGGVDAESMFAAIEAAYAEMSAQLAQAADLE